MGRRLASRLRPSPPSHRSPPFGPRAPGRLKKSDVASSWREEWPGTLGEGRDISSRQNHTVLGEADM